MLSEQDLKDQRELIQDDLQCLLDDQAPEMINAACQIIVDRFASLLEKAQDASDAAIKLLDERLARELQRNKELEQNIAEYEARNYDSQQNLDDMRF